MPESLINFFLLFTLFQDLFTTSSLQDSPLMHIISFSPFHISDHHLKIFLPKVLYSFAAVKQDSSIKMQIAVRDELTSSGAIIQGGLLNKETNQDPPRCKSVILILRTKRFAFIALTQVRTKNGERISVFSDIVLDIVRKDVP